MMGKTGPLSNQH